MNDYLRTLYAFNLAYCENLLADIADDEMLKQPSAGVNPPAWLLGHLAICTDYALDFMGRPKQLPEAWFSEFGPQSDPLPASEGYPTKDQLLDAHRKGHALVDEASRAVSSAQLAAPNPLPFPFLQKTLPTIGDMLAHLMTTHEASHLGHLSNWRRQMGRRPLF